MPQLGLEIASWPFHGTDLKQILADGCVVQRHLLLLEEQGTFARAKLLTTFVALVNSEQDSLHYMVFNVLFQIWGMLLRQHFNLVQYLSFELCQTVHRCIEIFVSQRQQRPYIITRKSPLIYKVQSSLQSRPSNLPKENNRRHT